MHRPSKAGKESYLEGWAAPGPLVALPEWLPLEPCPAPVGSSSVVHGLSGQASGRL